MAGQEEKGKARMVAVVPSCSAKNGRPGDETWNKLLDARGSPAGEGKPGAPLPRQAVRSPQAAPPPHVAPGVKGLLSPIHDDGSIEGKIARLAKRLTRNLPAATRAELEQELEVLKVALKEGKLAAASPPGSSTLGAAANRQLRGARRKVGLEAPPQKDEGRDAQNEVDLDDEEDELVAVTVKVNKAAPKIQHPQTMARMADWKGELERRIKEQREMDGVSPRADQAHQGFQNFSIPFLGGPAETESPLGKVHEALDGWVGGAMQALGLGKKQEPEATEAPQPLPPQTFSRRL